MDPERVRAYLQVACAGLGFDIGEIWWTSNHESTIGTRKSHGCVSCLRPRPNCYGLRHFCRVLAHVIGGAVSHDCRISPHKQNI
jgi:hypothetical protein